MDEPARTVPERLLGAALRGLAVAAAAAVAALLVVDGWRALLGLSAAAGAVGAACFALERRDRGLPRAALAAAGATLVALVAVPAALEWARHHDPTRPSAGVEALSDWLGEQVHDLATRPGRLLAVFPALLAGALLAGWAYVRARTDAVGPQVATGALAGALAAIAGTADASWWSAGVLLGGLAPALVAVVERRLLPRVDPRAPRPVERDPRPLLAGWALALVLVAALHALDTSGRRRAWGASGWTSSANPALPLLNGIKRAQRVHGEVAASTVELPAFIDPRVRAGLAEGYVLRVVRSAVSPTTFGAAADPIGPAGTNRFLLLRPNGGLSVWPGPVALDLATCEPIDK